jgi:hypothetical protein
MVSFRLPDRSFAGTYMKARPVLSNRLQLIACEAFAAFVRRDRHYSNASRIPLAETYRAVYA